MNYLTELDYSELIDHLIACLRECHADDIIRQIRELETVNIIEEAEPAAASAARKPPNPNQIGLWENTEFEEEPYAARRSKKGAKKLDREAVSEYCSRPMSCREMYYAAVDILEAYLLSVPKILEGIEKNLYLASLSDIVWENESVRHEKAAVNIIEAAESLSPGIREEMEKIIKTLKNVPGKEQT